LCRLINEDVNEQVMQVLGPEDLQSIIYKLEEHEEFFPAFQAFTNDLLEILEWLFAFRRGDEAWYENKGMSQ
ncbi:centrosomal protein 70, partial [Homo sapiens]